MGALLSRRSATDTYYANYEKAFERLEKESARVLGRRVKRRKSMEQLSNIGFWATALGLCVAILLTAYLQQVSSQKWYRKSMTILAAFAVPLTAALLFRGTLWLLRFGEARDERFLRKLADAKRKMVKDLKDSTRFEKTAALIRKYDPDEQAPSPRVNSLTPSGPGALRRRPSGSAPGASPSISATPRPGGMTTPSMIMRPAAAAASAAVSVATGTGKALMPVIESLANNLVGDNPVLLQEAQQLREKNGSLEAENNSLKARLAELEATLGEKKPGEKPATPKQQVASSG